MEYDLKLKGKKIEGWVASTPETAIQSYEELHPGTKVIAWRQHTPLIVVGIPQIEDNP